MENAKDKKLFLIQIIHYDQDHCNKTASRAFKTTVKTLRKWIRRFKKNKYQGLED